MNSENSIPAFAPKIAERFQLLDSGKVTQKKGEQRCYGRTKKAH